MFKIKFILTLLVFLIFGKAFSNINYVKLDSTSVQPRILKVVDINSKSYFLRGEICVFIFLDVECPISKYYTQNLQKIFVEYNKLNVVFFTVFPTKYTHKEDIDSFNEKYELTIPSILDKFQNITKKLNATITPEVFILNKTGQVVYSGGIDDSYFAIGKRNLKPKKYYFIEALSSIINKKKQHIFHSNAVGCEIQRIP